MYIETLALHPPQRYADMHEMAFIETSAKTNMNVKDAFYKLAREICELKAQQSPPVLRGYDHTPSLSLARNTQPVYKAESKCSC